MKVRRQFTSIVLLLILIVSCRVGKGDKPLIGGTYDRQTGEALVEGEGYVTEESVLGIDELPDNEVPSWGAQESRTSAGGQILQKDLEQMIPAPLTDRTGYITSYNRDTRIPNWTAWVLTDSHTSGNNKRQGVKYHEDGDVPLPKATNDDYYNSGYDRGHMCPAGDNKWAAEAMEDCFLFTNMCPQNHNLNGGDWNELEMQCRKWAMHYGKIYIVCGPILFREGHKTIGENKVRVPEAFFKVILRMGTVTKDSPKAIAFIYRNEAGNRPKGDYVNSLREVERITGITFFPQIPKQTREKILDDADLSDWEF